MSEIFKQEVKQRSLLVAEPKKARAIGDPIRASILQILSEREASIAEIKAELEKQGIRIAPTTVRHHVDILKKAGLIQLTRLVNSRGGVLKYYASRVKVVQHSAPENFDETLEEAVNEASDGVLRLFREIFEKHKSEVVAIAKSLKPCPYCSDEHFVEYVLIEVLNRAIAEATRKEEFKDMLKGKEEK
jgi:DNA-binding transcriptional ArsR family regulator